MFNFNKTQTQGLSEDQLDQIERYAMLLEQTKDNPVLRDTLLSTGFAFDTDSKFFGDVKDMRDVLYVKTKKDTPLTRLLAQKGSRKIYSHEYEHKIDLVDMPADPSTFKIDENGTASTASRTVSTGSNKVMRTAVSAIASMEAREVAVVPNRDQVIAVELDKAITTHNFIKEYYMWFGNNINPNETSGLYTILAANTGSLADYTSYTGPTGENVLQREDLEDAVFAILDNGASIENLAIFAPVLAMKTISTWFEDKVRLTNMDAFSFMRLPIFPTYLGDIPIIPLNTNIRYSTNVLTDKLVVADTSHLSSVNLINPFSVDMPITFPLTLLNRTVVESWGFEHGLLNRFALIEGFDKA